MDQQQIQIDPASLRKAVRTGITLLVLFVIATSVMSGLVPYTDFLWYVHDVRYPQVFTVGYKAQGLLFLASFFATWAIFYFNLRQAFKMSMIYLSAPDSPGQAALSRVMQWVQEQGRSILKWIAPLLALFVASSFSGEWKTMLLAQNGQSFGMKDPMFGLDAGFYVFTLPWLTSLATFGFALLFLTSALTVGLYVGIQSLALIARVELNRPHFRIHVGLLIGTTLLSLAALMWLKSYEYTLADSAQFTGAGFVESQQMFIQRGLAIAIALVGLGTLLLPKSGKPYGVPMAGGIAIAVLWGLGMLIYPVAIRRLVVDPDRLNKEGPYADRAIQMTRYAYGLDKVEVRDMQVQTRPSAEAVKGAGATLSNMRLWDPEVLRRALESLQGFRPYYEFEDVDIDRYMVDGQQTPVMISARDLELSGLEASARNWTNLRLRYTHGYGVTISRVDRATEDGRPEFLVEGIPIQNKSGIVVDQPRIYFSDWQSSEYALVNSGEKELDYETATGATTHQWQGNRGIPVSGFLARAAFSAVLGDGNLLVSPNIKSGARLLMRRSILDRAGAVMPFLKFDTDPYLVVLEGKLIWVLDGYSTTNMMPYSSRTSDLNYIRNTVKATIDAYTGEVRAYAVEPDEPLLRAYRRIYPDVIRELSEAPAGLQAHFRYPEDMLKLQASKLERYHVKNPTTFLSNSDAWNIATEIDIAGNRATIRPYYVQMKLPDEPKPAFMQILPFTPNRKPNMSGWLAAHCDPESYGRLTMYRFVGATPDGPELAESNFNSTPDISEINRQFNNEQSLVIPGNLLVMPIGRSVMYVEPLFLQSKTSGIQAAPRLSWVVLAFSDRVVVGRSYNDALRRLLQTSAPAEPVRTVEQAPSTKSGPTPQDALQLLRDSEEAMKSGDWGRYGELQKRLKQTLEQLVKQ